MLLKTELLHSYSSASLSALGLSESSVSLGANGRLEPVNGERNNSVGSATILGNIARQFKSKVFQRKTLAKKFPVVRWLPQYTRDKLIADIIAGITVGLTILPQGLAYATVGGLPPQYGLYSGFVGCFIYILFGSSNEITIGPTAVMAIITFTYTHGKPPEYAVILCFLTGLVTILMGVFQLGFIVNFISTPVNSGFTSAAAITICSTQIKALFGLKFSAEGFVNIIRGTIDHITEVKLGDSLLSLCCITFLLILMKLQTLLKCVIGDRPWLNKIVAFISTSRNAIIVISTTIMAASLGEEDKTFDIVGKIHPGLPTPKLPPFTIFDSSTNVTHSFLNILQEEGSAVIVMPLLAIMEHITIAKAFAGDRTLDANQEMISIGFSNLIGSFFSSMPITGSFSRTTVNAMSGVKTPLGGIVTGTMVILALSFLTTYFYFIPKASLASVIITAVIFMVDFNVIKPMWRSKKMEFLPWGLTFLVSLLIGLEFGMMTGFLISVIYLLYYAARPGVKVKKGYTTKQTEFILVELDRSLTFPSVEYIRHVITKSSIAWGHNTLPMVVDCVHIQFADFTAAQGLRDICNAFTKRDQMIILWKVKPSLCQLLDGLRGDFNFCYTEEELELRIDARPFSELTCHTPHPAHRDKFSSVPL